MFMCARSFLYNNWLTPFYEFLVLWLQIFHPRKVIVSSLWNCYSEEVISAALWSFLLSVAPFLSLLLPYKNMRNSQKRCWSTVTASDYADYATQKQLLAHVKIIMKHNTPIYNRLDVFARVLLYIVSFEIARLHTWTNRFWMFFGCNLR